MENIEKCGTCRCNKICDHNKYGFENCGNYISADVVPRSEYEKAMGVIKEVHRLATEVKADIPLLVKQTKTEVAREIFKEIEEIACVYKLDGDFYLDNGLYSELKKKYIGDEK